MELKCPLCGKDDIGSGLALCLQCGATIQYNVKEMAEHHKRSEAALESAAGRLYLLIFIPIIFFLLFDGYLIFSSESREYFISSIIAAVPTLILALVLYLLRGRLMKWVYRDMDELHDLEFSDEDTEVSQDIATFFRDGREIDVLVPVG